MSVCAHPLRLTIKDAIELAVSKDGQCLSTHYINNAAHLEWRCNKGHVWQASYNCVQKHWCPICGAKKRAKNKTLSIESYRQAAIAKGGECLSTVCNGCYDILTWKCNQDHIWTAVAHSIKNTKRWCPICSKRKRKK